jgi:cell division protein FtsW
VRWYSLGFRLVQPSEFLKPLFVVFAAWLMAASDRRSTARRASCPLLLAGGHRGLLAMQPDFGQACAVLFAWGVMYFVAGAPMLLLWGWRAACWGAGTFAYNSEHFARRIDAFLSPDVDPTTSSAMPPTRSARAAFSASASARAR